MTRSRTPQYSFSSGEISPLLWSRPDYQRNQTGMRKLNGFIPLRQGGFTRAPGTIFRGFTRNNAKARLIRNGEHAILVQRKGSFEDLVDVGSGG